MVDMESEQEIEKDFPPILQLHSWGNSPLPVAALKNGGISPSREILLLQSRNRDVLLVPLGPSSATTHNTSVPVKSGGGLSTSAPRSTPKPFISSIATPGTPTPTVGRSGENLSSPAVGYSLYGTPFVTPPSSPGSAAFANVSQVRGNPLFESPTTPYFTPAFNPLSTPPLPRSTSRSSTDFDSLPYSILRDVDQFSWGCCGDGFGSNGPSGPFKELLFTFGPEGLFIHCFSHKYRADAGLERSVFKSTKESNATGGQKGKERKRREGKWRNWAQSELDSSLELRRRLDETAERGEKSTGEGPSDEKSTEARGERPGSSEGRLERGKRKQRGETTEQGADGACVRGGNQNLREKEDFVSYVIDTDLEDSADGIQLRFFGASPWPSSAEVVSFRVAKDSPSFSLLTSLKRTEEFQRSGSTPDSPPSVGLSSDAEITRDQSIHIEQSVQNDGSLEQVGRSEIADIISNPSYNVIGIVAGLVLPECARGSRDETVNGHGKKGHLTKSSQVYRSPKAGEMSNLSVAIAVIHEWGVKWIAHIDVNNRILKKTCEAPWSSFVLASDRLLGLKENGDVFVWAALSGSLVAHIDVVKHCGLRPSKSLVDENQIGKQSGLREETEQYVSSEKNRGNSEHISSSGHSGLQDEGTLPDIGNLESKMMERTNVGNSIRPNQRFTHIAVTANCLLMAVSDDQGLLLLVSTDDYFRTHSASSTSTSSQKTFNIQNLKQLSYWHVGGSDIGSELSSTLLPDRRWLDSFQGYDGTAVGRADGAKQAAGSREKATSHREGGPVPLSGIRILKENKRHGASGFTSRTKLARHGAMHVPQTSTKRPIRCVFLPCERSQSPVALALNSYGITALVRPLERHDQFFSITQNVLRILGGSVDERDLYQKVKNKVEERVEMRRSYEGDALAFCSQGFLYLVTATSLHVVLPPLTVSSSQSAPMMLGSPGKAVLRESPPEPRSGWDEIKIAPKSYGSVIQRWQLEVLDRALVWDGLEEAEFLCLENGWSLQMLRLRRLQLALDFVKAEDVEQALEALVHVGAAESGVLCVLFAALELMLKRFGSDNELAQASRLLSLAASFTTRLLRVHGMRGWHRCRKQPQHEKDMASKKSCTQYSKPSNYKSSAVVVELARFLEVIRSMQDRLEAKRKGPNRKADSGGGNVFVPSDGPNITPALQAIEEGNEDSVVQTTQEQGSASNRKDLVPVDGVSAARALALLAPSASSSAILKPAGDFTGAGTVWELSPTGLEGGKSRRESPAEMFSRWENENVDAYGIVRDALKFSGRLALAVAQLHRLRSKQGRDGSQDQQSTPDDVFSELLHIGRGIVYDLFCKGKTTLAMAGLRRLGEDIEVALRELALGTLRRFLRAQAVKELQRLGFLSTHDFQLLERASLIEKVYTSSSFWTTYGAKQRLLGASSASDEANAVVNNERKLVLMLDSTGDDGLTIECGEVDGVVRGSWSMVDDSTIPDDLSQEQEPTSGGYWAAAAVWLHSWDQPTVDRVLLEQPLMSGQLISWEAKLEFNIAHHNWDEVAGLLDAVPLYALREGELHVQLDCDDILSSEEPFPGVADNTGSRRHNWSDLDIEVVEAVVPKIHILVLDLTDFCSRWMWQMIEEKLVKSHIFLRTHWKGTLEVVSLFARAGLLFHRYGGRVSSSRSKDGSLHGTVSGLIKGSRLHKDAVRAIHELVVQHCVRHRLPHVLELYLDHHALALDKGSASVMQALVGDSQWALWLLYSRLQRREYDASFANARTILAPSQAPGRHFEVSDIENFLPRVDDMAEAGGEIMALSTLMYAPVPLQKCLSAGSVSRHGGPSWQCTLENLQPGLQGFPTLWRALFATCFGHDPRGYPAGHALTAGSKGGLAQYLQWREGLFSSASGDTSLLQMMPRWLPQRVRRLLQLAIQGPGEGEQRAIQRGNDANPRTPARGLRTSYVAELRLLETQAASWETTIQKAIEEELYSPSSEDAAFGCEHHLRRGRALAAFNSLLGSRVQSAAATFTSQESVGKSGQVSSSEVQMLLGPISGYEEKLLATVVPLAIMQYENPVVVAACALFCELCGLSANLVRIDVAALKRISEYCKFDDQSEATSFGGGMPASRDSTAWAKAYGADVANSLAQALADEYLQAGIDILSSKASGHQSRRASKTLSSILQLLEKATLQDEASRRPEGSSPGSWLFSGVGIGSQIRITQRSMSERWSLVTAFCRAHHLPLSTTYLALLARDNDWVGLLVEAQLEGCPLDTLLAVVSKELTDARLQSHLLIVLKSLSTASEKSAGLESEMSTFSSPPASPVSQMGMTGELFNLLAECEHSKRPGKALLTKAKDLRWPLLAVVASCFNDVTPLSCLTVWLEITAARETSAIQVSDAAAQISARVAVAVEATNASAASTRSSGFRFSRTCAKRRRRMLPEEDSAPADGHQATPDEATSSFAGVSSSNQPILADTRPLSAGQKSQVLGDVPTSVADVGTEQESLAAMVAVLCEQQRFLPLLRAFELFTPASSFLPFLQFLQAFSQMRISDASAYLAAFTSQLKDETHQQQMQNKSGKSSTAWITKAAIAAADSMHSACSSAYERRCLLQLLSGSDFGDGGLAAMRFRRLYWKIQLAEPALREGSMLVADGASLDDEALLNTLEKSGQWEQARSWARQLDLSNGGSALHHVTETQAEAMVIEWKELLWDVPEERVALWNHCQALFTMHAFPALRAGKFFLKHADSVEQEVSATELHNILLLALQWLSGSISNTSPVYPLHLLHELETRVWLLAVESSVETQGRRDSMQSTSFGGSSYELSATRPVAVNPVDRTAGAIAIVDSHLKRSNLRKLEGDGFIRGQNTDMSTSTSPSKINGSKFKRRQKEQGQTKRIHLDLSEGTASDSEESPGTALRLRLERKNGGGQEVLPDESIIKTDEVVSGWEERVGEREVERAVLALLEVGQVSAAKQLQQKLSPGYLPRELSLVEAALQVAALDKNSPVPYATIQSDNMEYLRSPGLLENLSSYSPFQVLDVLRDACREGCGRGLCRRISAVAQIATFLNLEFNEAYSKSPLQLLQLLALKGQDALEEAKLLVATHTMVPASIARILAESFLKGLLAAHRGGYTDASAGEEGPAPLLWRPSDFIRWAQVCPSQPEIGHALMRLVISGRDMPHACEVELIILAHRYYESSACLDGVDVLVALACTRVESYVTEGDFASLARLVTGISNFQALRFILDLLIENGQLELLLQKRSAVDATMESSASIKGFRMAVLSALKLFNPHDLDAFAMVYSNFSMAHEMAALLESRGQKALETWVGPDQGEESLEMMRFFLEAAEFYSGIDAGNRTRWCCAKASLISLQRRMPDFMWLNLTDTQARRLLVDQPRFQEALIVAEAYNLNQSAEWGLVIWNQMGASGRIDSFLHDFVGALPLTHSMLVELVRFYRAEITARVSEPSHNRGFAWLTPGEVPTERIVKSFRSVLKYTRNVKERLQLATFASELTDVVEACLRILDNLSTNSGPLILRKGHGGSYLPIM